jgi:Ser/Thr protein kinase RdoA (MazF antagonist)
MNPPMNLTDAQAQNFAAQAAALWGGETTPRLIKNRENAVFEVTLPQGRAALRLHRRGYQTAAAIRSELWWCEALAKAGLPVPTAIRALTGDLLADLGAGQLASVIDWVDGLVLGQADIPLAGTVQDQCSRYAALGALIARIHIATDALDLPPDFDRPRWDIAGLVGPNPLWGRFWDHPVLSQTEAATLRHVAQHCRAMLTDYATAGGGTGLIHADLLRENVILHPDTSTMTLIDFDDSGFGFRLFDLGTALSQNLYEPSRDALREAMIQGYGAHRPLSADDIAMVPVFTLLRCLASLGWTMGRLSADHPRARQYADRAILSAQLARLI